MAVWLLPTIVIILGIITLSLIIFFRFKILQKTVGMKIDPNLPFIDCTTRIAFTNGYSFGLLKTILPRKNGTFLIEMYPLDYEQGEDKPMPEIQSFVVNRNMVKPLSKGENSSRREIIKILARNPLDIPEKIRVTDEGTWMMKEAQYAHLVKTFGKAIPAGDEAISEIMDDWARGEMSRKSLSQTKEELIELRKMALSLTKDETSQKQ